MFRSTSNDSTIKIWGPINGGNYLLTLNGYIDHIWTAAFSPDGSKVESGGWDKTVKTWNARIGGKPILTLEEWDIHNVSDLDFSPNGTRIAIVSDGDPHDVEVWKIFSRVTLSPTLFPTSPPVYTYPVPSKITGTKPVSLTFSPITDIIPELDESPTNIGNSYQGLSVVAISSITCSSVLVSIALMVCYIYTRKKPENLYHVLKLV